MFRAPFCGKDVGNAWRSRYASRLIKKNSVHQHFFRRIRLRFALNDVVLEGCFACNVL
ncbi:MAG TPA: hypothetical protein DEF41_06085 [Desulfovibrio sp.]|uniref:Uncharacterized protein n=1 Tax=Nitratidesulfovibrio vulgaris (strain ATCC 29579 / DSM 644 / CCUG 34227 / NCIMB 8303 / VKM B-1760 / Hildenborough) TaxID=882 RepID=Q72WT8_NITV2|nr:hypothetical protein DVUA0001 [Nitratidesulfovibrio vulgaris str. Hildenborough]HBW15695.1 hypothetical protein [Desulfovibrio sp.]